MALASFLIFWRINYTDIIGDDGHYSFRAVGLTDWLLSEAQSTPLHWFDTLPWWSYLSFHDHPLALFVIQHIFFAFGVSTFAAKLPFTLFGLGTICLTYAWVKNHFNEKIALASALLITVSANFIALARRPLMETGVMFFLALALYYFVLFLKDQKYWWKLGLALGFLVQVKLTVLFIFPTLISYLLLQPTLRKNKTIWKSMAKISGIIGIFAVPTLIYEVMMYKTQGHFSYQYARLLGQDSPWQAGGVSFSFFHSFGSLFNQWLHWYSIPFIIAVLIGITYCLYRINYQASLPLLGLFWLTIQDLLIGAKDSYALFFPVILALAFYAAKEKITSPMGQKIFSLTGKVFILYLFIYTANSIIVFKNHGPVGWLRTQTEPTNYGLYQLDAYLDEITVKALANKEVDNLDVYSTEKQKHFFLRNFFAPDKVLDNGDNAMKNIIVYDSNLQWFARTWIYARRLVYDNLLFISTKNLPGLIKDLGYTPRIYYFIKTQPGTLLESPDFSDENATVMENGLISYNIKPEKIIYRADGVEAFRIYHIKDKLSFLFE